MPDDQSGKSGFSKVYLIGGYFKMEEKSHFFPYTPFDRESNSYFCNREGQQLQEKWNLSQRYRCCSSIEVFKDVWILNRPSVNRIRRRVVYSSVCKNKPRVLCELIHGSIFSAIKIFSHSFQTHRLLYDRQIISVLCNIDTHSSKKSNYELIRINRYGSSKT